MQYIIARYNENVSWADNLSNKIIYNKGNPLSSNLSIIPLKNVGREGHTFAEHIVRNYESLAEYTCFLQGNPFDHYPHLLTDMHNPTTPFRFLSTNIITCNLAGCKHHNGLPLRSCYNKMFGHDMSCNFIFGAGAQMIVSRYSILQHPKEFYQNIVDMLSHSINPIEGFVIERFWGLIFDHNQSIR